jgi:hypothetical protein
VSSRKYYIECSVSLLLQSLLYNLPVSCDQVGDALWKKKEPTNGPSALRRAKVIVVSRASPVRRAHVGDYLVFFTNAL